ncbi:MAG: hypothetical protein AAF253_12305, partial [Pseudomonadota bacterium]
MTSRDLSDRRPTYVMDTPCLTRNYVIRYGEFFDVTRSETTDEGLLRTNMLLKIINTYIAKINEMTT